MSCIKQLTKNQSWLKFDPKCQLSGGFQQEMNKRQLHYCQGRIKTMQINTVG